MGFYDEGRRGCVCFIRKCLVWLLLCVVRSAVSCGVDVSIPFACGFLVHIVSLSLQQVVHV